MIEERLCRLLIDLGKDYPHLHKQVQYFIDIKDEIGWADEVLLPHGGWISIFEDHVEPISLSNINQVGRLATLGTWKYAQGVYRFDPEIYQSLIMMDLPDMIPLSVFSRLPEWSVYVETPNSFWMGEKMYGFWAYLDTAENTNIEGSSRYDLELRIVGDLEDESYPVHHYTLSDGITISEAFSRGGRTLLAETLSPDEIDTVAKEASEDVKPYLSLLLYICSDEPEISGNERGTSPTRNYPQKVKGGKRLFVPNKVRTWTLGKDTGEAIRAYPSSTLQGHKAKHVRRAHWHGYWTGKGRTTFVYRWLYPNVVGGIPDQAKTDTDTKTEDKN